MAFDAIGSDVKLALRSLRHQPGFALVVILTLALGIGATVATFSVVDATLLRPLPFDDPERLVMVWETDRNTGTTREAASVPDFYDFEARSRSFEALAAYSRDALNLARDNADPERLSVARVTHDLLPLLGRAPAAGRGFTPDEDRPGGETVVLISHGLWMRLFGADPSAVGSVLTMDDVPYRVVGVLPEGLGFPDADTDVWVPLQQTPDTSPRYTHPIPVVGRLRPDVALGAVRGEMDAIASALEAEYESNLARGVFVEPLTEVLRGDIRRPLAVLFAAVVGVLLIACANVANLMLARGTSRRHELAVARALGAARGALTRRFLVESLVLSGLGTIAGLALADVLVRIFMAAAPSEVGALGAVRLDGRILAFALIVGAAVTITFGLVPLWQTRRIDVAASLREGRGDAGAVERLRARRTLVVAQTALAIMLLVVSGLLVNSFWRLRQVDPGFDSRGVLRATFNLPPSRYPRNFDVFPAFDEVHAFNRALVDGVRALPGVESAAITSNHPLDPGFTNSFVIVGREAESSEQGELKTRLVSSDYHRTAGVALLEGRTFSERDTTEGPPVMLLNRAAVAQYFPDGDALGARIRMWGAEREVVGIVENERMHGLREATPPGMYLPFTQAPSAGAATLLVETGLPPRQLASSVREVFAGIDPGLAIYEVSTMDETLAASLASERFTAMLLASFAGVAVLLAALGVYGVLSYLVVRRRHEVGVRMALGASTADVVRLVLRQGLGLIAVGVAAGLLGALQLSSLLRSLVYDVSTTDPVTYGAVTLLLVAVALVACSLPAWRATRVDPVTALRIE